MTTNSTKFREQVREHIAEINELNSTEDLVRRWLNEKPPTGRQTYHQAFQDWCGGIPSTFSLHFETHKILAELRTWFEGAGLTFDETRVEDNEFAYYVQFMYKEICNTNDINTIIQHNELEETHYE